MTMETPLAKVRGLGAAGDAAHHWWHERVSSVSTFLLLVWLAVALLRLPVLDHETLVAFLSGPLGAVPMALLIVSVFWHLKMGLRVVIEDYVHDEGNKLFSVMIVDFLAIFAAALALFALLSIVFGGSGE